MHRSPAPSALKLIWDVVTQMKVGERGQAYVVDGQGRLIVHRDITLVLGNTDMTQLAQVRAARIGGADAGAELVQEANPAKPRLPRRCSPIAPSFTKCTHHLQGTFSF